MTLSILETEPDPRETRQSGSGARVTRGHGAAGKYKFDGVRRIFVIGLIPNSYENYQNVEIILSNLDLDLIDYNLSTDFKVSTKYFF